MLNYLSLIIQIGKTVITSYSIHYTKLYDKKDSPLYGMPILNVDQAKTAMVVKRSLNPGFAGEDNELFYEKKTMMVFGDAKNVVTSLVQLLKK